MGVVRKKGRGLPEDHLKEQQSVGILSCKGKTEVKQGRPLERRGPGRAESLNF